MSTVAMFDIAGMTAAILAPALAMLGSLFLMVAALGLVRMPGLLTRMHAASVAATLGVLLVVAAAAVHLGTGAAATRAALIGLILVACMPLGSHALARAHQRSAGASAAPAADEQD